MKKRESLYIDGLDKQDKEKIESLSEPWQQSFITRFYKKLEENNLTKKDICNKIKNSEIRKISDQYRLNESTLSQYTNYNSNAIRPLPVNALISIAHALNVSVDYLLGIESCEQHDITNIYDATGLTKHSLDFLKSSTDTQAFINSLLQSKHLNLLMHQINHVFYSEYISSDILSAYSESLRNIISSSFSKYIEVTLPIERNPDSFKKFFTEEFSNTDLIIDKTFICANVSEDRFNQISLMSKFNNIELSQAFFDDTVSCIYDILAYMDNSDYYRRILSDSFLKFIDDFLAKKNKNLSQSLKLRL